MSFNNNRAVDYSKIDLSRIASPASEEDLDFAASITVADIEQARALAQAVTEIYAETVSIATRIREDVDASTDLSQRFGHLAICFEVAEETNGTRHLFLSRIGRDIVSLSMTAPPADEYRALQLKPSDLNAVRWARALALESQPL